MSDPPKPSEPSKTSRPAAESGRLGPYRIMETIGSGGMGRVFLAEDTRLKRSVALKVMNEKFAATPGSRKRFLEEARAMAAVDNDNVVRIYEVGEHDKTPFMAMELLKGQSLEAVNAAGESMDITRMIDLACQACHGLSAAHQRGIVHRDIKPANIWIEANTGRVKILDFGLAQPVGPTGQLAGRGSVVGTPGYLSPEQARNEPLDDRSDLYSLGVVLFELCTGKLPFQAKTIPLMLIAIITHSPPKIGELRPELPRPFTDLIDRLLAKEARDRPASAMELAEALRAAEQAIASESHAALQIVTDSDPPLGRAGKAVKAVGESRARKSAETHGNALPIAWIVGSAISISVLLIAMGMWWFRERKAAPPRPVTEKRTVKQEQPITVTTLRPLVLRNLVAVDDQVGVGDVATLKFELLNQAVGRPDNPAYIHRDASTVAECHLYLRPVGGARRENYALPLRRRPSQLPGPGKSTTLEFRFPTSSISLGDYQATVTLETPRGAIVNEQTIDLSIVANLRKGELVGFQTIRTWAGSGADTTLGKTAAKDAGEAKQLTLAGSLEKPVEQQQFICLRFDLQRWPGDRSQLEHAVLLLTLTGDVPKAPFEMGAYVADDSLSQAWQESGDGKLDWSELPWLGNLGTLKYLGSISADNSGDVLKNQVDAVRLSGAELEEAIATAGDQITIILVRRSGDGKSLRFVAKESDPEKAPGLALKAKP